MPSTMRAMQLDAAKRLLTLRMIDTPVPGDHQLLVKVAACGVCRTDLHVIDGELPNPKPHVVPGHEVVGTVAARAPGVSAFSIGDRVGVPWLGWTCGECEYCRTGRENLCDKATFTGYHLDGGYAEFAVANAAFAFPLPEGLGDTETAPLLCAGMIGYRALVATGPAERLGIYGFGAAGHIVAQLARHQGRRVFAFTRPGDAPAKQFALDLGAVWAGDADTDPPEPLDAAIIFAPVGLLVPAALKVVVKGGTVVCAGIHMSDIPPLPYQLLWGERVVRSVANLTRRDGEEFLALAPTIPVRAAVQPFPLADANEALRRLREGELRGAAVLTV